MQYEIYLSESLEVRAIRQGLCGYFLEKFGCEILIIIICYGWVYELNLGPYDMMEPHKEHVFDLVNAL